MGFAQVQEVGKEPMNDYDDYYYVNKRYVTHAMCCGGCAKLTMSMELAMECGEYVQKNNL